MTLRLPHGAFTPQAGHVPVETPDDIISTDYAVIELLLGEAPLSGIPVLPGPTDGPNKMTANSSIYLNDIPIQESPSGSYNFDGVGFGYKLDNELDGNANLISNLHNPYDVVPINAKVVNGTNSDGGLDMFSSSNAVVWSIQNPDANAIAVTMRFPRLEEIKPNGDTVSALVEFQIQVKDNTGIWKYVQKEGWLGDGPWRFPTQQKSAAGFKSSYRFGLPDASLGPFQIKVIRYTADSKTDRIQNEILVDSYQEIVSIYPSYPGSAILQLKWDARTFQSPPTVAVEVLGLQVHYPSNYDVGNRTYSGVWDGDFYYGYCNNPAWIFRELATNKRWGLGNYLTGANIDDASLYVLSQYCDENVPGPDGSEPRYTFNGVFDQRTDAFTLLNNLASVFHGMLHYSNAYLLVDADRPIEVSRIFTPSNVVDGRFQYEGTGKEARRSVVHVAWNDPKNDYKQTVEAIQDIDLIARYGYVLDEVVAVGCTVQGEAQRVGRHILESEKLTQSVTFRPSLDAAFVLPGEVILTADPLRIGKRVGGRIVSATTTGIVVDSPVTGLSITGHMACYTTAPDGSVNSSIVSITDDSQTAFTFHDAIDSGSVPIPGAQWAITPAAQWRVISAKESDVAHVYEVTAAQYSKGKFAAIERQVDNNFDDQYTLINAKKQGPVTNIRADERLYLDKGLIKNQVQVSWDVPAGAHRYQFSYSRNGGPFTGGTTLELPHVEFLDLNPGDYIFRVYAINAFERKSIKADLKQTILGKTAPPPDVDKLIVTSQSDGTRQVSWSLVEPLDFAGVRVRYSLNLSAEWKDMLALHTGLWTSSPVEFNSLATGEYLFGIVAVDTSGNESVNPIIINTLIGNPRSANIIGSYDGASDGWSTDISHIKDNGMITGIPIDVPPTQTTWTSLPATWDGWTQWGDGDFVPATWGDLPAHWDSMPHAWQDIISTSSSGSGISETWFDLPETWEGWASWTSRFDQTLTVESKVIDLHAKTTGFLFAEAKGIFDSSELQWCQSDDGISYTPWSTNFALQFNARYIKGRCTVIRTTRIPAISKFLITIHGASKFRSIPSLDTSALTGGNHIATGDIRLPVGGTFATIDGISISFVGSTYQGFRYTITDYSPVLGPRIAIYNASGTAADAVISAMITGM